MLNEEGKEEELLEFLKRGEVRTMAKDIARLRKEEAGKELKRIETAEVQAPTQQKALQKAPVSPMPELKAKAEQKPLRLPQKPSSFTKIFIRILIAFIILFVLANAGAFAYWMLSKKNPQAQTPAPAQTKTETSQPQTTRPILQIPPPAFPMPNVQTIEIVQNASVPALLSQFIQTNQNAGFTRVVFENSLSKTILGSQDFFKAIGIPFSRDFAANLQNDFTLFVYASQTPQKERPGFVLSFGSTNGLPAIIRSWEPSMEKDFSPFFSLAGQKDNFYVPFFRTILYKKTSVRCQTFSSQDLGICYALVDNNFIMASSLESAKAIINQLTSATPQ